MSVIGAIASSPPAREQFPLLGQMPRRLRVHILYQGLPGNRRGALALLHYARHFLPALLPHGLRRPSANAPPTRTPSTPYAAAFVAIEPEAVCRATGREMAYWLLLQKKTVGVP